MGISAPRTGFQKRRVVRQELSLSACAANLQPVASGTRPITLDASYTRNFRTVGSVVFPKGVYQPSFQTEAGVFYEAPTFLIGAVPARGGLFIPHDASGKQACWFEPAFFRLIASLNRISGS
jgi:hypothetical protein